MTRVEQIKQAAEKFVWGYHPAIERMGRESFISGGKWSDENPNPEVKKKFIDDVCEWIENNIDEKYIRYTLDGCRDPEIEYWRIVEDFRKYMEERQ